MKSKITTAIIVILCIFIVINVFVFFDRASYFFSEDEIYSGDLLYDIDHGYYTNLMEDLNKVTPEQIAADITLTECYHVAEYFYNASMYKTYKDIDTDKAQTFKDVLNYHQENMGLLSYAAEDINTVLGI